MPALSFLRSGDKDKEREKENTSPPSSTTTTSINPSASSAPPPNHPFVPMSSASSAGASSDSPTSKYHPSRLLRRKASTSAKNAPASVETGDGEPLPTGSSSSSSTPFFDSPSSPRPLPSSPRRLPSSHRGVPASPRTFFGFDTDRSADKDKEKYHTFPRHGSEVKYDPTSGSAQLNGLPSPNASKRSAFVYNGRLTMAEGEADEPVVIIPGRKGSPSTTSRGDEDDVALTSNLAALGLRAETPVSGSSGGVSSSLPKVLDGGIGISGGMGVFGKIAGQDALVDTRYTHGRPLTPPDSASLNTSASYYPTALSPPRRPMPRSPRAQANVGTASPHSGASSGPSTPPSASMMQALSAVGGPLSTPASGPRRSPSPLCSLEKEGEHAASPTPTPGSRKRTNSTRPAITAEWLARKPSSSSGRTRHRPSLSADQSRPDRSESVPSVPTLHNQLHSRLQVDPPASQLPSTPKRQGSLDDSPKIESGPSMRPRTTSFSSTNSDTDLDAPSSDGEIGIPTLVRRRSPVSTPSNSARKPVASAGGYEVEIVCADDREDISGEMRWEVVIRRRTDRNSINTPNGPLHLGTNSSVTQAPASASSVNLSLALDQPTGKLVFISFPMDIHATPTRRRRPSATAATRAPVNPNGAGATSSPRPLVNLMANPAHRPSTPPAQMASVAVASTLSPSPNGLGALARTPSSRRKAPPPWPSPKADPNPADTADVFTPRKSRVTPSKLEGELLHKVTYGDAVESGVQSLRTE